MHAQRNSASGKNRQPEKIPQEVKAHHHKAESHHAEETNDSASYWHRVAHNPGVLPAVVEPIHPKCHGAAGKERQCQERPPKIKPPAKNEAHSYHCDKGCDS